MSYCKMVLEKTTNSIRIAIHVLLTQFAIFSPQEVPRYYKLCNY